nr:hypothetical protein [Paenibacillus sp. HW567]
MEAIKAVAAPLPLIKPAFFGKNRKNGDFSPLLHGNRFDKLHKVPKMEALKKMAQNVSIEEERYGCSQATAGLLSGEAALFDSFDSLLGCRNCSGAYNPEFVKAFD